MSVEEQLGLAEPTVGLLAEAIEAWPVWGEEFPGLRVVDRLVDLPGWLMASKPHCADEVLQVLVRLGSHSGGDDQRAAATVAWLLMPGAKEIARALRGLSDDIDALVATQFWLEIRLFPWDRLQRVAANILLTTRRNVLRDLGVATAGPPTVLVAGLLEVTAPPAGLPSTQEQTSAELVEVLTCALEQGVVDKGDVELLLRLAWAADETPRQPRRARAGLLATQSADRVARQLGVSQATLRRRTTRSCRAVAAAWLKESA